MKNWKNRSSRPQPILLVQSTISNPTRLGLLLLAFTITIGIAIARSLEPSPGGFGTHTQLGLPPCTFYRLFGIKCPSCGMTTAWTLAVRFQFVGAMRTNFAGTLLCLQAMLSIPYLFLIVLLKRDPLGQFFSTASVWGIVMSLVLAVILWVVSLL